MDSNFQFRVTMIDQFEKFLEEPMAGFGQLSARYFTG